MSNITGFKFSNQPGSFPGSPISASHSLKDPILQEWISLENGGQVNGQTVHKLVESAIQQQVKKSQDANAVLNSLTFGPQNQIGYRAAFTAPPANLQTPGAAGKLNIRLSVPGNNLAFTVMAQSNPT